MDKATGPGLALAVAALLLSVILEGGSPMALMNVPAAVLVFGGTIGVSMMSFPFEAVMAMPKFLPQAFFDKIPNPADTVEVFVKLADKARREGLLALEQETEGLDAFIKKGVMMVVDGADPSLVREVLEGEIAATEQRHKRGIGLMEAMGGFAPTMGIIGTVMGLVNVLSHLEDPSELGHSIATAFIATLYGVASANVLWLPLGNKLKNKSADEVWVRELAVEGILSVQAGDNPRVVRQKLEAQLAPTQRDSASKAGAAAERAPAPAGG
jgi:chemotaxis protein MotA